MFKRHSILMLSTEKASNIWKSIFNDTINYSKELTKTHIPQHLYILSGEIADKGDYTIYQNKTYQVLGEKNTYIETDVAQLYPEPNKLYKIISTTDKSLSFCTNSDHDARVICTCKKLPEPSDAFIKAFIEAYNQGNPISEVMVEYEELYLYEDGTTNKISRLGGKCTPIELIKVDKNNTISIRKIKDSYTRDEVTILMNKSIQYGRNASNYQSTQDIINNWIKENL